MAIADMSILFAFLAIITVIEIAFLAAVIVEKKWRVVNRAGLAAKSDPRLSQKLYNFWLSDLFFQRIFLLLVNFTHTIVTFGARLNSNVSLSQCKGWNTSTTVLLAVGKYASYLFLFGKQRVLKEQLSEKISLNEKVLFGSLQLMLFSGSLIGFLRNYKMQNGVCLVESNATTLPLIGISVLIELVNVFWLLQLFLKVIRDNLGLSTNSHANTPKAGRKSSNSMVKPSAGAEAMKKLSETEQIMMLNKRSCVISLVAFVGLIVAGVAMMKHPDRDFAEFINALARAGDLFADCVAMMLCSPKIWKTFKNFVASKTLGSTQGGRDNENNSSAEKGGKNNESGSSVGVATIDLNLKDPVEATVGKAV